MQAIKSHPSALQLYMERVQKEEAVSKADIKQINDNVVAALNHEFQHAKEYKPAARDWLSSYWKGFMSPNQSSRIRNTGVPADFLREVRGARV